MLKETSFYGNDLLCRLIQKIQDYLHTYHCTPHIWILHNPSANMYQKCIENITISPWSTTSRKERIDKIIISDGPFIPQVAFWRSYIIILKDNNIPNIFFLFLYHDPNILCRNFDHICLNKYSTPCIRNKTKGYWDK